MTPAEGQELPSVFWLGGGCGAGKTSVARAVARRLDLRLYPVDHYGYEHLRRSTSCGDPHTKAFNALSDDDRWLKAPEGLAATFADISRERMKLILDDLRGLGPGPTVVVEGPQLFPELVASWLDSLEHGLWLLPTDDLGRRGVAQRDESMRSTDVERANRNRYQRDVLLTELNRRQAIEHGLRVVVVDGSRSVEDMVDFVSRTLQSLPGGLARASDGRERQEIRVSENAVAVRQLRGFWDDMGRVRMPDAPVFDFSCECEAFGCDRDVHLSVPDYEARASGGPVTV